MLDGSNCTGDWLGHIGNGSRAVLREARILRFKC